MRPQLHARLWPCDAERLGAGADRSAAQDGCWVWMKSRSKKGYGRINVRNIIEFAHRVAWCLANGPIPEGLLVLHRCDNPPCVNPAHLFIGTAAQNTADMLAKGREYRKGSGNPAALAAGRLSLPKGAAHHNSKLNDDDVREIRALYPMGWTLQALSDKFAVHAGTIGPALYGRTWSHLPGAIKRGRPAGGGRHKGHWPAPGYDPSPAGKGYTTFNPDDPRCA